MSDELTLQRTILCDLLLGRRLRLRAAKIFELALTVRPEHARLADEWVAEAAQMERIAQWAELGTVAWGKRHNRCDDPEKREPPPPTVHILSHGRALCGSVHGIPANWGPQHRWVSYFDSLSRRDSQATCRPCKEAAWKLDDTGRFTASGYNRPPGER